eukprot:g51759.t1
MAATIEPHLQVSGCTCVHLSSFLEQPDGESMILKCFDLCQKAKPNCFACRSSVAPYACLHCVFVGCWFEGQHIRQHAQQAGHRLCADLRRYAVYCFGCLDYVYEAKLLAKLTDLQQRPRQNPGKWQVTEAVVKKNYSEPFPSAKYVLSKSLLGLRGMFNLGNSCFMNVVLQALIHNPLLRDYFLSDLHNSKTCPVNKAFKAEQQQQQQAQTQSTVNKDTDSKKRLTPCLDCELDSLYNEAYSGECKPISPHSLLYAMWLYADSLAGYRQQDAHECLMALLDGLHAHSGSSVDFAPDGQRCRCVVHQAFGGSLRSDVQCDRCNLVSSAYDPVFDISLDLSKLDPTVEGKLEQCLDNFTKQEKLTDDDKFHCKRCGSVQDSTKQFSIHTLPGTLCLHLKRFEHNHKKKPGSKVTTTKITTKLTFPLTNLNMARYLTTNILDAPDLSSALDGGPFSLGAEEDDLFGGLSRSLSSSSLSNTIANTSESNIFDLYAVIVHKGSLASGHYIIYLRKGQAWFKCDDTFVTCVTAQEVASVEGYLLFYLPRASPAFQLS